MLIPENEPKIKMREEIMIKYKKNYKLYADGWYSFLKCKFHEKVSRRDKKMF